MRIVLLGAPGSGKGTQAALLKTRLQLPHISTGEILRAAIRDRTPLGIKAQPIVEAGHLVSDELVLGMLEERLGHPDVANGFILDGYPRNLAQAEALDALLARLGQPLDDAIYLHCNESAVVDRLASRAHAEGRADDNPEAVRLRQKVYREQTAPVIDFYRGRGTLKEIVGEGTVDEVNRRITQAIGDPQTV